MSPNLLRYYNPVVTEMFSFFSGLVRSSRGSGTLWDTVEFWDVSGVTIFPGMVYVGELNPEGSEVLIVCI